MFYCWKSVAVTAVSLEPTVLLKEMHECKNSWCHYSTLVGERSIAISLSVCVCLSVCLSVREHISGTAPQIFTEFWMQIPCGRGLVLFWQCCDTLCTYSFMDDVMFSHNGLPLVALWHWGGVWCLWMPCGCWQVVFIGVCSAAHSVHCWLCLLICSQRKTLLSSFVSLARMLELCRVQFYCVAVVHEYDVCQPWEIISFPTLSKPGWTDNTAVCQIWWEKCKIK